MPKFHLEKSFSLMDALSQLGMPDMFSNRADFSKVTGTDNALFVSAVIHKAFIEVLYVLRI